MQGAAKVGLLVIIFLALLYGAYAFLGQSFLRPKMKTYFAEFADAGGVSVGTAAQMAGVKIGSVTKVQLVNPKLARLTLEINPDVQIPVESEAKIGGSLIGLGSSPIEIVPPIKSKPGFLNEKDTIKGSRTSPLEAMMPESKQTIRELNMTLAASRKLMENQGLQKKLEKLMDSSAKTLEKFGVLADNAQGLMANASSVATSANRIMVQNQASIDQAFKSASMAMSDIHRSTKLLTKLIESGKYQEQTMALLQSLNATAKKADDLMGNLKEFVADPEMQNNLKGTVANINKMSDTGTRLAANSEEITKNGITLSQKAIELTDKANAIADDARAALQKITGFFNRGPVKSPIPPVEIGLDLLRETQPNHWRTDVTGRFSLAKGFVDVGFYDAFESNKLIIQSGNAISSSLDYRYGIYASKPAIGVDYRVAPRVKLRSDLFDINKPRLDFRTQLDFGNGFVGWLGLEKIFDRNAITVGVGIRK